MFGRIARFVVGRPWWVIAGWVVVAAVVMSLAPSIGSVTNSDQAAFLPSSAESAQAARLARQAFPDANGASAVVVVKRADSAALTDADRATIGQLAQRLNAEVAKGGTLATVRGVAFDPAQSVAPNGTVALLGAQFTGAAEDQRVRDAVVALRSETTAALQGSGLTAGMTGQAAIVVDNKQAFADAEVIVTIATLILIVLLLLLIFRSPVAALLPLLTVGLVFGVSTALVSWVADALDRQVGQELPTMLTVVLFGIGTDYILFLLFRYRERLRAGDEPREAIIAAVGRVGEAIFSAAFAVIAAFAALVLATLGFFTTLGPALAIGVLVMLAAALTLVPAVVALLGRRVFWPSKSAPRPPQRSGFAVLGRFVSRRPALVLVGGLVLLGGLGVGVTQIKADYDPISQLPPGTEATRAYDDMTRGFPAGAMAPAEVYLSRSHPFTQAEIGAFTQRLAGVRGVATPLAPRVAADGRTVDVPLLLADDPYGSAALDLVAGPLREEARAAAPAGASVLIGGQSMSYADVRSATNRDLALIFPVAGALFVLILAGLLRALLAPVYLVAMVVAGFAATLGSAVLIFQLGLGHAGLSFSIPIVAYLFVTAIGTDYTILMTARLREELRDGRSPRDAAALGIAHAGPSIAAAALILAGTFAALLVSGVPFFLEIGFTVTLGIALVALVVSMLLVPAATALFGRAAWWPGRISSPREPLPTSTFATTTEGANR